MISFKGFNTPKEIILQAVRWYLAYALSYRDIEELLVERGLQVDHSTINRRVIQFAPLLEAEFHQRKRRCNGRLRLDETYIKVKGQWLYLYRAVDSSRETVDFLLTKRRNTAAAKGFLKKLIDRESLPTLINIDKSGSNKSAIGSYNRDYGTAIEIRQCKYLNNIIEQDHRFVKRKMKQTLGFKTFSSAQATIAGLEMWRMVKKGQRRWSGAMTPVEQFYALAS